MNLKQTMLKGVAKKTGYKITKKQTNGEEWYRCVGEKEIHELLWEDILDLHAILFGG